MWNVSRSNVIIAVFFSTFFIISCSSALQKKYEAHVNSFLGVEEAELVQKWGPPQEAYESGGSKYLKYSSVTEVATQAESSDRGFGGFYGKQDPAVWSSASQWSQNKAKKCITTFELVESKVVSYEWEGNNCIAPN